MLIPDIHTKAMTWKTTHRLQTFTPRQLNDDRNELFPIKPEHYRRAAFPNAPFSRMTALVASQVVNGLNRNRAGH
jgi:hypothetical protein